MDLMLIPKLDRVFVKRPGGVWAVKPATGDDAFYARSGDRWRHFEPGAAHIPYPAGLAALAAAVDAAAPLAMVAMGAVLAGDRRLHDAAAERLPGIILVGLSSRVPGPYSLLMHEIMHELWSCIPSIDQEHLLALGDKLREENQGVYPLPWFNRPGEAEAVAFAGWCQGADQCLGTVPNSHVIQIWQRIREGAYKPDPLSL